jgi:hypothetical protein
MHKHSSLFGIVRNIKNDNNIIHKDCIDNTSFSSKIRNRPNKLGCLFLAGVFQPSLMFTSLMQCSTLWLALTLLSNITIGWKTLPGTNTLAYWFHSKVTKKMKSSEYGACPLFSRQENNDLAEGQTLADCLDANTAKHSTLD